MDHPDVRLDIQPLVRVPIDRDRHERFRDDVLT